MGFRVWGVGLKVRGFRFIGLGWVEGIGFRVRMSRASERRPC